jgi:TATA-binding protein-associated factor Taf7
MRRTLLPTDKGNPDAVKKGVVKAEKSKKKKEEQDEEEEEDGEDEEEEEEEEDEEEDEEVLAKYFFFSIKHLTSLYTTPFNEKKKLKCLKKKSLSDILARRLK